MASTNPKTMPLIGLGKFFIRLGNFDLFFTHRPIPYARRDLAVRQRGRVGPSFGDGTGAGLSTYRHCMDLQK